MAGRARRAVVAAAMVAVGGCATVATSPERDRERARAGTLADASVKRTSSPAEATAAIPSGSSTPVLDAWIVLALENNPTVRAARFNVQALEHRLPQVTSLDDPVASNSIFPIPSVAPQYTLMGYMPYSGLLAQQFPWFGTLRLRGAAAAEDVKVALFELAAAQLDVVAGLKSAYHDVRFNERALTLLRENRKLSEDFLEVAKVRYQTASAAQADVLRAEVAVADVDREIAITASTLQQARNDVARLLHVDPGTNLESGADTPSQTVPAELERLVQIATASRPELKGRLAAVARDERAVELARKKFYPDFTLGGIYQDMERTNAAVTTAMGMPNIGMFVGFNIPIYHKRIQAGVKEAIARAGADAMLYEAERDQAHREVKDALASARAQQNVLGLLRRVNLPASQKVFDLTRSEYQADKPGVDYLTLLSAWRERLQVELQVAQVESELGKSLARLERAVGCRLNEDPPAPEAFAPSPPATPGPFQEPLK